MNIHANIEFKELEIWGTAQHEAARCRKSDWGDNLGELEFCS